MQYRSALKKRVPLLHVEVTPLTRAELLEHIDRAAGGGQQLTILAHNLHSVYLFHSDEQLRQRYFEAELVLADGMPVLAALSTDRIRKGQAPLAPERRLGSTDWVLAAVNLPRVERVALLGGSDVSNQAAAEVFAEHPVQVLGLPGDPWSDQDLDAVARQINAFDPQLLLVGMGMPLQERIASQLRERTSVPVTAAVGGALDQIAGTQSLAPRWLGRTGLEWAWRLASDPRRLAGRYLVEPFQLGATLMRRSS